MEGKVQDSRAFYLLPMVVDGLWEGLLRRIVVVAEGHQGGDAGVGSGDGPKLVGVNAVKVHVAVDESGEDEFPGSVDVAVGGRQEVFGANGGDFIVYYGNAGVVDLR